MNHQPLVSVIIIFLNPERFFQEAIESVLAQSYRNWELLLVDDGSTDGSTDLALHYARHYPQQIRYLEHGGHQNRGMSASRNLGLDQAQGQLISFLDADDLWLSNILEEQVSILQAQPEAAMVFGPIRYWYSWTGERQDRQRDFVENLGVPPNTLLQPPDLLTLFLQNKATVPSGILVRRETAVQVGGFEDSFRSLHEDQAFCAKICLSAPVYVAGESWYWYRQHPQGSCAVSKTTGEYYTARHTFLNWLTDYLSQQSVSNPELWQALNQELMPFRHPTRYKIGRSIHHYKSLLLQLARSLVGRILPASSHWLNKRGQAYRG